MRGHQTGPDAAAPPRGEAVWSLAGFRGDGYDKGRPKAVQALWFATQNLLFGKWWLPAAFRVHLLRLFGARIGPRVLIRQRVRVHWPWKLEVGPDCWIGEGVWLLNLEPITLGGDVCLSQESFLCTGSHDATSPTFEFDNRRIDVGDGCWVGARAIVLRGVELGAGTVVGAQAVVTRSQPPASRVPAGTTTARR